MQHKASFINNIIEISNLTVCYQTHMAIDNVSLTIRSGEVLALLGENGAGKSTLINSILGRIKPKSGSIKIFGQAPGSYGAKLKTGTILQSANLPDNTTVEEQVNLFRSYYIQPMELSKILQITLLDDLKKRKIKTLSGGQKQRVFFALAICGQPDVIFLDEPTVGLDTSARREFWRCIEQFKKDGVSMVLTTHYMEEAEALADQVVLLNQGHVINRGSPEQIKAQALGKQVKFNWNSNVHTFTEFLADNASQLYLNEGPINEQLSQLLCQDNNVEFITSAPESILRVLFTNGADISNLTVESTKLEDAVLALNKQSTTKADNKQAGKQSRTQEKAA